MSEFEKFEVYLVAAGIVDSVEKIDDRKDSKAEVRVAVDGKVEHVFTNDFLLLYLGEQERTVVGTLGPVGLLKATSMVLYMLRRVTEQIPMEDRRIFTALLLEIITDHVVACGVMDEMVKQS